MGEICYLHSDLQAILNSVVPLNLDLGISSQLSRVAIMETTCVIGYNEVVIKYLFGTTFFFLKMSYSKKLG